MLTRTCRYCTEGHKGVLCAVCEEKWHRAASTSTCTKCAEDMSASITFTACVTAGFAIAVITIVLLDLRFGWSRAKPGSQLLKSMVNCVQQMTVMLLFPVKWPDAVKSMGALFASLSFDVAIASPECLGIPMNFFSRFAFSAAGTNGRRGSRSTALLSAYRLPFKLLTSFHPLTPLISPPCPPPSPSSLITHPLCTP